MTEQAKTAQNPLILRYYRLMAAFSKADDERDFYLDNIEGFLLYADLEKNQDDLNTFYAEIQSHPERYFLLPKLTFYETKKIMESFVNEKVYDIDTKERLLDIIQSRDSRENFLEFIYEHEAETEKWQQFYQERFRIRIIEWLRQHHFDFVFEEDLDLNKELLAKVKKMLFKTTVPKEVITARGQLRTKAKTYYSNEALNPRPKRGRPPKQVAKIEVETQMSADIYESIPISVRSFLFAPEVNASSIFTFSSKLNEEDLTSINALREAQPRLESTNKIISFLPQQMDFAIKEETEEKETKSKVKAGQNKVEKQSIAKNRPSQKKKKEDAKEVVKEKKGPRRLTPVKKSPDKFMKEKTNK